MEMETLKRIVEAALLAAEEPLSLNQMEAMFLEEAQPGHALLREALKALAEDCEDRGIELREVASGFRLQVKQTYQPWVSRLWQHKPPRYSRALLETLSLIAYRQPVTRGEIEEIRGVAVSTNIMRTLQEREWVRVLGHRDVPGRPALYGTTRAFLDYFDLKNLDELPTLAEIRDIDDLEPELDLALPGERASAVGADDDADTEMTESSAAEAEHPDEGTPAEDASAGDAAVEEDPDLHRPDESAETSEQS